jgi:hypothetical protein
LSVATMHSAPPQRNIDWLSWLPYLIGLAGLYIPSYYAISQTLWREVDQAHGPIVLMVIIFLAWQKREHLVLTKPSQLETFAGWACLLFGLACYVLGRSQDILMLDIGSQIPVLMGVLLLSCGRKALKAMWFPLFFIIFMLPLPLGKYHHADEDGGVLCHRDHLILV